MSPLRSFLFKNVRSMIWKSLLALFLEEDCPLCHRNTKQIFCVDCQRRLDQCQLPNPMQFWQGDLPLLVWGRYEQELKRAIAALKYEHNPQIGKTMGFWLGKAWLSASLSKKYPQLTVIPIPMHSQKLKERGFNQAELIARGFSQFTGYPLNHKGLVRIKETEALFNLNKEQRQQQLKQAFSITKYLSINDKTRPILLIDDIYTTGTTAKEAKRILQNQGFSVIGIAAVSTTQK